LRRGGEHAVETQAVLTSTTIAATPRLFLRTPQPPTHNRYAGVADSRMQRGRAPSAAARLYSPGGMSSPAGLHRRPWLARLRRALGERSFVLHYQPIVSLQDGQVSHYEALVRLADDPSGLAAVPPPSSLTGRLTTRGALDWTPLACNADWKTETA